MGGPCPNMCRSELAREKLTGNAFIQEARVIVDAFREQARSYTPMRPCQSPVKHQCGLAAACHNTSATPWRLAITLAATNSKSDNRLIYANPTPSNGSTAFKC